MKKIDIEFETEMRLEQARFDQRKLELEMQRKELETKHQLLEEERELERKVKRTALVSEMSVPNQPMLETNTLQLEPKEERCLRLGH